MMTWKGRDGKLIIVDGCRMDLCHFGLVLYDGMLISQITMDAEPFWVGSISLWVSLH